MSTLKTSNIQHASAASAAITLDANGQATLNGLAYPTSGSLSGRNRIINGDMRIDQRNAGASVTPSSDGAYTVDRWFIRNYGGTGRFSVQQDSASPNNADPSVKLTVTTTDTPGTYGYSFGQSIEGFNFSSLAYGTASAQTATVSFWVRSSVTGTYCFSIRNSATNRSYVAEYSISAANTWQYKTITFAGDTTGTWLSTNGTGATLEWSLGSQTAKETTAGSWQAGNYVGTSNQTDWISTNGATFYITGVQLEAGSVATPFERRSYGQELSLCQRYYWKNEATAAYFAYASGFANTSTQAECYLKFAVRMRSAPTAAHSGLRIRVTGASPAVTSLAANYASTDSTDIAFNVASGLSAGYGCIVQNNGSTSDYISFDSEL